MVFHPMQRPFWRPSYRKRGSPVTHDRAALRTRTPKEQMRLESDNAMTCCEAQLLMSLHLRNDPSLPQGQREALEAHLLICSACSEGYEDDKRVVALLRRYWSVSEDTEGLLRGGAHEVERRRTSDRPWRPMSIQEGWADLKRRCPSLAEACRRDERNKKLRQLAWGIGSVAAAACVLIAIGIGWLALRNGDSGQPLPGVAVNPDGSSMGASAELVTSQGRRCLPLNRPHKTHDRPQEVLLGGMHRVVMNRNTTATFAVARGPARDGVAPQDGDGPYEIQLAQGELYVEVVPGHPFTVKTDNARLVITGTKFDVLADRSKTELVLLKGAVRFSQPAAADSFVDVTTGYASTIVGRSGPSIPRETDARVATAWARALALTNAIASAQPDADLHLLDSIRDDWPQPKPLDLESIDYVKWRDDRREWFAREFPWIFRIQSVLKEQHGIEADYVELLVVSGDIWQFNYPRPWNQPIPILNAAAVRRAAGHYGVDPAGLLDAVAPGAASRPSERPVGELAGRYRSALRCWHSNVAGLSGPTQPSPAAGDAPETRESDLLMFTLRAGTYLANTRTAAWIWTWTYPDKAAALCQARRQQGVALLDPDASGALQRWLDRLSRHAVAADSIAQIAPELITAPRATGCEGQVRALSDQLAEATAALLASEGPQ